MKGKIKFILGLGVGLFLGYTALNYIESDSIWAHIVSWICIGSFIGRMIYGLITGK